MHFKEQKFIFNGENTQRLHNVSLFFLPENTLTFSTENVTIERMILLSWKETEVPIQLITNETQLVQGKFFVTLIRAERAKYLFSSEECEGLAETLSEQHSNSLNVCEL